jgi:Flp pilus assembly pilin Flp
MTRKGAHMRTPNLSHLITDTEGQDMVEYCLILACIALLAITSSNGVAANVVQMLTTIANGLTGAI